ncbi:shikimate kinase [Terriglobus sp.]|uniref:shikimate kinase n=1 Tax=Terriglobus sp. TaxID=1889013 RepID=UPI003AFF8659
MPTRTLSTPTRIVLTGFMGAGKSTVGSMLAGRLGWRFVDVDDAIVQKAGTPIAEIFAKYGEFVFRRMETSAIAHALGERDAVIALGGGAVEVLANRLLLEQTPRTTVVFLDADLPVLLARCQAQTEGVERPNLQAAEERFRYRAPLYKRVARVRIATADQNVEQTVSALLQQLGLHGVS